jgi:tetraprenyl-beta-curcumene synthase
VSGHLRIVIDFLRIGADYWLSIYPQVARELRRWRKQAVVIPDPTLRRQALEALQDKRRHAEGAAAFAVISPRAERGQVVRFLVAFQVMYDYLDTISEQPGVDPLLDTMQLHTALTDALMPEVAQGPAYALHPQQDDGGYLAAFVDACRTSCSSLPAFPVVAPTVRSAARLAIRSQGYNHALPEAPTGFLMDEVALWASREGGDAYSLTWWEVIGATGSSLAILALVAAAADPKLARSEFDAIHDVYVPWAGAVLALIDSLVDEAGDSAEATHSLVARYPSAEIAAERVSAFAGRALALTQETPHPERHALIVTSMIALFASSPEARDPQAREALHRALDAAGLRGALPRFALRAKSRLSTLGSSPPPDEVLDDTEPPTRHVRRDDTRVAAQD